MEGEHFVEQNGQSETDYKRSAVHGSTLGKGWGERPGDSVRYNLEPPRPIPEAVMWIRFAREWGDATPVDAYLDDRPLNGGASLIFPNTGGWGHRPEDWRWKRIPLVNLKARPHKLVFISRGAGGNVNFDGFLIAPAWEHPEALDSADVLMRDAERHRVTSASQPADVPAATSRPSHDSGKRVPEPAASLPALLGAAAAEIDPSLRNELAAKPSPYLVKAHDVGEATNFHADIPWHLLDKEIEPQFALPDRGTLGVLNTNSDIHWRFGFGVDADHVTFDPPRRLTDHTIDLAAYEIELKGVTASLMLLPTTSDTLLAVIELENRSDSPQARVLRSEISKEPLDERPFDRFGYGIHPTTGKLLASEAKAVTDEGAYTARLTFQDCSPRKNEPVGKLLCTVRGEPGAEAVRTSLVNPRSTITSATRVESVGDYVVELEPGARRRVLLALNLHRFGPERFVTNSIELYPKQTDAEAMAFGQFAVKRAMGTGLAERFAASYAWYQRVPRFDLPAKSWAADTYCALELPRGNTWSPQEKLQTPWYTFCRVHGHNPYSWWSYGMHAHEHLSTFTMNITEPTLSQSWLRGHFAAQLPSGEIPYGVNLAFDNVHRNLATAPLLAWESWNAYLWSGDRKFLQEAYASSGRFVRWWRSAARSRPAGEADGGAGALLRLQHWRDWVENVRDDKDLPTWAATGGAENQEALDLNCYLLNEERTLAQMATELQLDDESRAWTSLADERAQVMQARLWHAEDGVFYGRDLRTGKWARVLDISTFFPLWCGLATREQAARIVRLLHDPTAFDTAFPVATLAVRQMPERHRGVWHWRGANWVEMTWLVTLGLKRYGYHEEAARIAERNCRMVYDSLERTGHFREFYNTFTGAPSDLTDYIWTSLPAAMVVDIFFGVRPTAQGVEIDPALPAQWPRIAMRHLQIRDQRCDVAVQRIDAGEEGAITSNLALSATQEGQRVIRWQDWTQPAQVTAKLR